MYLTRRCLVRHRTNPEPGFEVDRGDLNEITPFLGGFLSRVGRSTRTPGKNNVQLANVQTAQNDSGPLSQRPTAASNPNPETRVVHDQDAEDAALEVLPPMYSEAWGQRRSNAQVQDASSRVVRREKGRRAEEGATASGEVR